MITFMLKIKTIKQAHENKVTMVVSEQQICLLYIQQYVQECIQNKFGLLNVYLSVLTLYF